MPATDRVVLLTAFDEVRRRNPDARLATAGIGLYVTYDDEIVCSVSDRTGVRYERVVEILKNFDLVEGVMNEMDEERRDTMEEGSPEERGVGAAEGETPETPAEETPETPAEQPAEGEDGGEEEAPETPEPEAEPTPPETPAEGEQGGQVGDGGQ